MKKFIPIVLILMLTGCGGVQTKTVYQDVYIPIPIIPYPPEITEPEYYTDLLTEEQKNDEGELSKAYVISSMQCIDYSNNLKRVYETYQSLARNSENRLEALKGLGAKIDRSLMEQASEEIKHELNITEEDIETQNQKLSRDIQFTLEQMDSKE
jgi:hypothetical protein